MSDENNLLLADRIDGIPHPSEHKFLTGHEALHGQLIDQFNRGRIHHAHLLVGPRGIGKSTLAFRLAAEVLGRSRLLESGKGTNAGILAHPNLCYISKPYDHKDKKFKTQLTVDEVRRTNEFFTTTRGANTWRVVIVDAIDDMNENSQNALLKILEEPPTESLFFLIAHRGDRILPTIRSRTQMHLVAPLDEPDVISVITQLDVGQQLAQKDIELAAQLGAGSARTAISIIVQDGLQLYRSFEGLVENPTKIDWSKAHTFADGICLRTQEDRYRLFGNFAQIYLHKRATDYAAANSDSSSLARWVEVWEKTRDSLQEADRYNLDRKQVVLGFFRMISEVA